MQISIKMDFIKYLIVILINTIIGTNGQRNEDIEHCIDSNFHKKQPAKEDSLHNQCEPWKQYSCCTQMTTLLAHGTTNHYKFNYNHCSGQQMSEKCKKHFIQDLCFYECEPFLKPWVKEVNRSFARERFFKVPICSSDCQLWWSDCKHDLTCAYNWARGFNWKNGTNQCNPKAECQPIGLVFKSAQEFCQNVWDDSWEYTTEDKPCMRIWFNGSLGNPNKATAQYYYLKSVDPNGGQSIHLHTFDLLFTSILFLIVFSFY